MTPKTNSTLQILFLLTTLIWAAGLAAQKAPSPYSKEAPVWLDFDMRSIPEPNNFESGYTYDFLSGTLFQPVKRTFDFPAHARRITGERQEAYNVNTLDEVPDSSWFTNRNGRHPMSPDEIRRGVDPSARPAPGILTVTSGKLVGVQPGFVVRDERGEVYFLKFDPADYPELATAAEVISTSLFHAIGYNAPDNSIVRFSREQLRLDAKAKFRGNDGKPRTMTDSDVDTILSRAPRQRDGLYRALASRRLNRRGNSSFRGLRVDDPNDIIPHEHRRELRGLRVFCAWLAHNDIRDQNTMDVYVTENGRKFLRHYLADFGSTLGSGTTGPNLPFANHEHRFDSGEVFKTFISLGIHQQSWRTHPEPTIYPSVGVYSAHAFNPDKWKPEFPLTAFQNMTDRDAYWAARVVSSFTDDQIRSAVAVGELSDADAAEYLAQQIMLRRDIIIRHYFQKNAALDHFAVEPTDNGFVLRFSDLRDILFHPAPANRSFEFEIRPVAKPDRVLQRGFVTETQLSIPSTLAQRISASGQTEKDRGVARLSIRRNTGGHPVHVYLFFDASNHTVRVIGVRHG